MVTAYVLYDGKLQRKDLRRFEKEKRTHSHHTSFYYFHRYFKNTYISENTPLSKIIFSEKVADVLCVCVWNKQCMKLIQT